jgi:uncharacterized protein YbjT (DUF2867 family)
MPNDRLILLTGATGYVGGRLLEALLERGASVRCLSRRPEDLRARVGDRAQVAAGDVHDRSTLDAALAGVHTAYYLVHALGSTGPLAERETSGAQNFAEAAKAAGVQRIIYLGGLADDTDAALSPHLRSRQAVGRILRDSGVPTIEFRASIIIGSGSLSFELVRSLVRKLPVMITPRWTRGLAQPIAIEDVIDYLLAALDAELRGSVVYEIGGPDRVSYVDLMREYARQRGLRRWIIPVPVLTPGLSSLWLGLVTPVYARVGRKLIESVRHDTVVKDDAALERFSVRPRHVTAAITRALENEDREFAATRWSDAMSSSREQRHWATTELGGRIVDSRMRRVAADAEAAFAPIRRIGGRNGWYFGNLLWRIRGVIDLLFRGPGLRRGRRNPEDCVPGDALDFWRVEAYERPRLLRLNAEMRVPGRAWLQFEVEEDAAGGGTTIRQTALFDPAGLGGLLYWYALWPIHQVMFAGMLRAIARRAENS